MCVFFVHVLICAHVTPGLRGDDQQLGNLDVQRMGQDRGFAPSWEKMWACWQWKVQEMPWSAWVYLSNWFKLGLTQDCEHLSRWIRCKLYDIVRQARILEVDHGRPQKAPPTKDVWLKGYVLGILGENLISMRFCLLFMFGAKEDAFLIWSLHWSSTWSFGHPVIQGEARVFLVGFRAGTWVTK